MAEEIKPGIEKEKPEVEKEIKIEKPEKIEKKEVMPEKIEEAEKIKIAEEEVLIPKIPSPKPPIIEKSETMVEIESILEKGLEEIYASLDEEKKKEFKNKEEETASKIEELFRKVKIKITEIFRLILNWLKNVPRINKFFLEQEAKIKTDKIITLAERKGKEVK